MSGDTLILNADYRPLSLLPLSIVPWQEAIKLQWLDKLTIIEVYDNWEVHSPNHCIKVPAIGVTKDYFKFDKHIRFSRRNVFLRDLFTCQYCGDQFAESELTIDHVIPRASGGKTSWLNCVAACNDCNRRKAHYIINPRREPFKPDYYSLIRHVKTLDIKVKHPSWETYLRNE